MTDDLPINMDPLELEKHDPMQLQSWFTAIAAKQDAHNTSPETAPELTTEECRFAITLTRILRRTNTGPARAKKSSAKAKPRKMSQDEIDAMFK